MSLTKRGEYWYYNFQRGGKRFQRNTYMTQKRAARAVELAAIAKEEQKLRAVAGEQAKTTAPGKAGDPTVGQMAAELDEASRSSRKDADFYKNLWHVAIALGVERPIRDLSDADVRRVVVSERIKSLLAQKQRLSFPGDVEPMIPPDLLPPGSGPRLTNDELDRVLHGLARDCEDLDLQPLQSSAIKTAILYPISGMRHRAHEVYGLPKPRLRYLSVGNWPDYARRRVLSYEEEIRLERDSPEDDRDVVQFALQSCFRLAEIAALTWIQVDLILARFDIVVKGGKTLVGDINRAMAAILLRKRGDHDVYVFTRLDRNGERVPMSDDYISLRFRANCDAAGLRDITFHDLRRTGATRLYLACTNIETVRLKLGHKEQKTTWGYIGVTQGADQHAELKREIMDRILKAAAREDAPWQSPAHRMLAASMAVTLAAAPISSIVEVIQANVELGELLGKAFSAIAGGARAQRSARVEACSDSCSGSVSSNDPNAPETRLFGAFGTEKLPREDPKG